MNARRTLLLPVLALLAAASLGCGAVSNLVGQKVSEKVAEEVVEKSIEAEGGGDASVNITDGQVSVQTGQGAVSVVAGGDITSLPADFPSDVPLYPGAKIVATMGSNSPDGTGYLVNFETPDSADKVAAFYKEKLGGSFKTAAEMNMNGALTLAYVSADEKRNVTINAGPGNGVTAVALVVGSK